MDRSLAHTSSLAQRFFNDAFPDAQEMPLLLPPDELRAYQQHVVPLLQLGASSGSSSSSGDASSSSGSSSLAPALDAVRHLTAVFCAPDGLATYEAARSAAEYVQSRFALSLVEAAAAASDLLPGSSAGALAAADAHAAAELLAEDLRRRLLANGLPQWGTSAAVVLDAHPAVAAAAPCAGDMDRLVLPVSAGYAFDQPGSGSSGSGSSSSSITTAAALVYRPFQLSVAAARRSSSSGSGGSGASQAAAGPATILKRAAWRRQLARGCSHYVAPLLGSEGRGSSAAVVLTGSSLAAAIKGVSSGSSSNNGSSASSLAFVGYAWPAAAQQSLDGCLAEVLTRYFKRHPVPLTSACGQPLLPLAVATAHHLLLLLPEPTQPLLPATVQVDAAAVAAAAEAGAAVPAVPAAAAAAPAGPTAAAPGFRDIVLSFDLALHPDTEVLLLGAPHPLAAFAWDGDEAHCLASSVRALAAGGVLIDAAAAARGPGWCSDPQPAGEAGSKQQAAAAAAPAGDGASVLRARGGVLTAAGVQAVCQEVAAAVAEGGWQPLLLLPAPAAGAVGAQQQRTLLAPFTSAGLALQLPLAPARLRRLQQLQCYRALEPGGLLQQLLLADVGLLLRDIRSSGTLRALVDCWPAASGSGSGGSEEQQWQQAAAAGSSWRRHVAKLLPALQQQQSSVADALDLAVPAASVAAAAAAAASIGEQQPGSRHTHAGTRGEQLSPLVVMTQPQLLRAMLDHSQQQQQQQQQQAAAPAASPLPARERQRLLQQLRQAGWVWGCVQPPQPGASAAALPAHVADVLPSRWWPGPVMRGSALLGSVLPQE